MASIAHRPRNTSKPYAVRYRDESGKQREASFRTKTEATRFMTTVNHGQQNGTFTDPKRGDVRFMDYAATVLDSYAASEGTLGQYRQMLGTHVSKWANGRSVAQVANDRTGATQLVNVLMVNGSGELLSFNRRGIALTVIRMALDEAVANKIIPGHGMAGIKIRHSEIVKADRHADFVFPSHEQVTQLAEAMNGYAMAIWLSRACGLRIGEALAVEKSDFIDGGTILRVTRQASDDGTKAQPLKHRRTGQYRDVPVPSYLWAMVKNLPEGIICAGTDSPYFRYNMVQKRFRVVSDRLGIDSGFTLHSLRHAFATALLTRNVPIHAVSQWLGHGDVAVTSKIYAHILPSSATDARSILDSEFSEWAK